jgi:hypothetical protein
VGQPVGLAGEANNWSRHGPAGLFPRSTMADKKQTITLYTGNNGRRSSALV